MQSIRRPGWHRSARALCMHVIRAAARLLRRVGPGPFGRGAPMPIISPLSFASRGFPRFAWARPALSARRCPHNQRPGWHGLLCGYAPAGCSPLSFASRRFRRFARMDMRPGWHGLCGCVPAGFSPLGFASRRFRRFARCLRPGWHRAAFQLCTLAPIALCPAVSHGLPKPPLPYPGRAAAQTPSPLLSFDVCGQNPYFVSLFYMSGCNFAALAAGLECKTS